MATRFSTHHIDFRGDVVVKRYSDWSRGEPRREWTALELLDRHTPGLAPRPVRADIEHISRLDGSLPHDVLLAHLDLRPGEAARVHGFRRLVALGWLLQLGPTGAAAPHNPPGTARRIAERVLDLLG